MGKELQKKLNQYRPFEDTTLAREYLSRLCDGDRPTMGVPPRVEDWDMVFCRIIKKCEEMDEMVKDNDELMHDCITLIQSIIDDGVYRDERLRPMRDRLHDAVNNSTQPSADVCEILEHLEYCIDNHTTSEDEDMAFRGIKKLRADLTQPKGHVDGRTHYDLLSHACTMADELAHLQKNTTEKDRVIDFDLISEKLCKLYQMARHNPEASKLYGAISLELDKLGGE